MDPVTLTLMGASLAGGIVKMFSKKKQKEVAVIDPEWLKQHFGARAVNQETIDLFNSAIASPQGQQLMASAAEQGARFGQDTRRAAAEAGLGAGSGATSGSDIFATSASEGAGNALQRDVKSGIYQNAMTNAQNIVNNRMSAYMNSYNQAQQINAAIAAQPSRGEMFGDALGSAAGTALSFYTPAAKTESTGGGGDFVSNYTGSKLGMEGAGRLVSPAGATITTPQNMLGNAPQFQKVGSGGKKSRFEALGGLVQ